MQPKTDTAPGRPKPVAPKVTLVHALSTEAVSLDPIVVSHSPTLKSDRPSQPPAPFRVVPKGVAFSALNDI